MKPVAAAVLLALVGCGGQMSGSRRGGIRVDPPSIRFGESALVTWGFSGAETVSVFTSFGEFATSGSVRVSPSSTTTYYATARFADGTSETVATTLTVR